jgi:hypothetical protein
MENHFATLDLETISTAEQVIVTALQSQGAQWEQDAQDAIAEGHLATAQQFQNWSFAANLLATTASIEISVLMGDVPPFIGPVLMRVGGRDHAAAPC